MKRTKLTLRRTVVATLFPHQLRAAAGAGSKVYTCGPCSPDPTMNVACSSGCTAPTYAC